MEQPKPQIAVSNEDFLRALFGDEWEKAHVTSFLNDPSDLPDSMRNSCWAGEHAKGALAIMSRSENQYFTISLFHAAPDNVARRRKDLFDACFVVVADDVNEKIPEENAARLPAPSYKLQTSAGSEQWGWILDEACTERSMVENLLDGLVARGLAPSGRDPGMKGVTRYVRLPCGSNTKKSRLDKNGRGFKCHLTEWEPSRVFSIEALAAVFDIDLYEVRNDNYSGSLDLTDPIAKNHPIFDVVRQVGAISSDGWINIDCPNVAEHSVNDPSGAAILIRPDASVAFQCHHGACNGDRDHKVDGDGIIEILNKTNVGFKQRCTDYVQEVSRAGVQALIAAGPKPVSRSDDGVLVGRDSEFDLWRYVYLPPENKFFDSISGALIQPVAFDALYLKEFTGTKGNPKASKAFFMGMTRDDHCADGLGWLPTSLDRPERDSLIMSVGDKRLVNTWGGLAHAPVEGDVTPWLEHAEYLLPDARQREVVLDYLASSFQRVSEKPAFCLLNRGSHRVGKDMFFKPVVRAFGEQGSGSGKLKDVAGDWGDFLFKKKFLIIEEVDEAHNHRLSNALKTLTAPTATGVRTLNVKTSAMVTQADVAAIVMMSNHHDALPIEKGDERYFVVDSFVKRRSDDYYSKLHHWLEDEQGHQKVLHYLMTRDISAFNHMSLPYLTAGAKEMMEAGKRDFEHEISDMVDRNDAPFCLPLFTMKQLRAELAGSGFEVTHNQILRSIKESGFNSFSGVLKIDGKPKRTGTFFTKGIEEGAGNTEVVDFWKNAMGYVD